MEQFPDDYECDGQIDIWEWMEEKETQSMTREEEAIKNIKEHCYFANLIPQAKEALDVAIKALEQEPILNKIKSEIEAKIEEEEFARSVFRGEEKDAVKAEQCTGSIMAYNNVIKFIDKYAKSKE